MINIRAHFQKAMHILIRGGGCVVILQCARTVESVIAVIGSIHLLRGQQRLVFKRLEEPVPKPEAKATKTQVPKTKSKPSHKHPWRKRVIAQQADK